ncbi:MAG: methionyl-tRNA formyltransferase [Rikenellaceae bacterium]
MSGRDLRIVFMGTPEFAAHSLRDMHSKGYNVVAAVTVPDKPAGRGLKVHQSDVKQFATSVGIPVLQPEKLRDEAFISELETLNADLFVVVAFRMLPEVVWAMPKLGTFNLHASLLPKYRGAAPINWAIINGETKTGVTTFMLNHNIDEGDMLFQREVEILHEDTIGTLYEKLMYVGADLITETVDALAEGRATRHVQSEEGACPAPKIFREDCVINWNQDVSKVYNFVRGLSPYPAASSQLPLAARGENINVKLYSVKMEVNPHANDFVCGTLLTNMRTEIKIACNDGFLIIEELQVAGKKRLRTKEFLLGFKCEGNEKIEIL